MSESPESVAESFFKVLVSDVVDALARWKSEPSQANGRNLVRTVFAAIEGMVWEFKQHIVGVARDVEVLTREEEIALSDTSYLIAGDGSIQPHVRMVPHSALIRAISQLASRLDRSFEVDFGQAGWSQLKLATSIRNRITHPKQTSDMLLSPTDVAAALAALFWLLDNVTRGMGVANQALRLHNTVFRQLIADLEAGDPAAWAEYRAVEAELLRYSRPSAAL